MVTSRRILVIFPGALGDLICALPAIEALAMRHPGCEVELMAKSELAEFAIGRTRICAGHPIERREVAGLFAGSNQTSADAGRFFGGFERIYSFFGSNDESFRRNLRAAGSEAVEFYPFRPEGDGHIREAYLASIADPAGQGSPRADRETIHLTDSDLRSAQQILAQHRLSAGAFVLIAPGSGSGSKNWPLCNYLELAKAISIAKAFLLGPAEAELGPLLKSSQAPVVHDVPLGTAAAMLKSCGWYLGNDSGISHLAGAVGARGIALFGATAASRWRPCGRIEIVRANPLERLSAAEVAALLPARIRARP
jgi:heptosyltransferase-3